MSFSSQLDAAYKKKVEDASNQATRKTALDLVGNLAAQTPVDTGLARRNWITSVSQPSNKKIESPAGDPVLDAASALSSYDIFRDGPIWISNNLPYIGRLNDGWSNEVTPQVGWVDAEVSKASRTMESVFKGEQ